MIETYWKNPLQYWLPRTSCALIANPENYRNLRSVGCSTDETSYLGTLNAPFLRTDVPYNSGRCSHFSTDTNSCEQISGCTWNNPIIESCTR